MLSRLISSTRGIPERSDVPQHIAIVMDGNGRWARKRLMPRVAGHKRGLETVRQVVRLCVEQGVRHLTLFAFSSENWRRPEDEVSFLMQLFMQALREEVKKLHKNRIRLRVIGDLSRFDGELAETIRAAESLTRDNDALTLTIAANYGGRWDIVNAVNAMLAAHPGRRDGFGEEDLAPHLCLADLPEPDLYIRTGGEQRVSNFLLWQLAYTEFYFTDCLWPDFDSDAFARAIDSYRKRERRFGRTSEQLVAAPLKQD
ncbi:MAG: polyprenyl diphosphate synthase [Candidatus Dactylopiibacterium sp.]|nr:polyprenyl diphosphate synthase [Candidatus Dactylopiibacterium sp.]